ncbi:N-methyl-L-tryptophan oxidase [Lentibacillus cibarius]|uniref:N-methyl-L-tryptophan oxidase n=1 Tax=Lentibacillus cibarius TaxID=2583219 RepID=A0A5S3R7H4_9BACI|nr:N-methyl-L-tryptophan oxidase [Lentibacillus cibarius]TMN21813.1 N-methyl-L-tryptophan oxidase [Lentibacillus cibarius]
MDADVGVIGVGTIGSMAFWQLAQEGVSVIGFEQFGIGHDRSAAGGETRIFRTAYKEGDSYVPVLEEAYNLWRKLESDTNNQLLTLTKGLMIGDPGSESIKNIFKSIEKYNLEHSILDYSEAKKHYPQHHLLPNEIMVVDYKAGYISAQYSIISAVKKAVELGAILKSKTKVEEIEPDSDGVRIVANGVTYKVGKVLITAGPWSHELLRELRDYLEVRRLINGWFFSKGKMEDFGEGNFPVFMREVNGISYYGVPAVDNGMVKIGLAGTPDDRIQKADHINRNINIEDYSLLVKTVNNYFTGLYKDPARVNAYMETYTKDKHAIVGKLPGYNENVVVSTGFSGHGFKMAPVLGKISANLVMNQKVPFSLSKLSPDRFLNSKSG